jgi:hypothetical protein
MSPSLNSPNFQGPQDQGQPNDQGPGGGFPSPAPGRQNPDAMANLDLVKGIVSNSRLLAQKIPGAVDIVRQINELAQKLQMKIIQSGASPEPQAPPV